MRCIDALFPQKCLGCAQNGTPLCISCLNKIPSANSAEHSFIQAIFDYRHPLIKDSIWRFKYKNMRGFAEVFADVLYDEIVATLGEGLYFSTDKKFLLVPIPLHPHRLRERGYNQSELLARAIITRDNSGVFEIASNVLIRTRRTTPQARSEKRSARITNLKGAFNVADPSLIKGRIVILIDDVTTTGATLLDAKRALQTAKPRKVLAFTVGH